MITLQIAKEILEVRILLAENISDLRLLQINGRSRLLGEESRENHRKRRLLKRRLFEKPAFKLVFTKNGFSQTLQS